MRYAQLLLVLATAALTWVGCASSRATILKISGTPRAHFTIHYQGGTISGEVSSSTGAGAPSAVVEASGRTFRCDISKADPIADLIAEVVQDGESVYRVEVPPGNAGIRIFRDGRHWKHELF